MEQIRNLFKCMWSLTEFWGRVGESVLRLSLQVKCLKSSISKNCHSPAPSSPGGNQQYCPTAATSGLELDLATSIAAIVEGWYLCCCPCQAKMVTPRRAHFLTRFTSMLKSCSGASECLHRSCRVSVGNLRSNIYLGG